MCNEKNPCEVYVFQKYGKFWSTSSYHKIILFINSEECHNITCKYAYVDVSLKV